MTDVTIVIPTSPIPSHPSTEILDQTIDGIRFHFPDAPIVIMADGVWDGMQHRRAQYEEYLRRIKNRYPNTTLTGFAHHSSQAKMTRMVLEAYIVKTRFILFNEHDITLRKDVAIDWETIFEVLRAGRVDVVRLCGWEMGIHEAHEYLVHGEDYYNGSRFVKTRQWSQWPHVSTKEFYLQILGKHFQPDEIGMIEETMHGVCQNPAGAYIRLWQYIPEGEDKRCFYHLNGRKGDPAHWE